MSLLLLAREFTASGLLNSGRCFVCLFVCLIVCWWFFFCLFVCCCFLAWFVWFFFLFVCLFVCFVVFLLLFFCSIFLNLCDLDLNLNLLFEHVHYSLVSYIDLGHTVMTFQEENMYVTDI